MLSACGLTTILCGASETDPAVLLFGWTSCDAARRSLRRQTALEWSQLQVSHEKLKKKLHQEKSRLFRWADKVQDQKKKKKKMNKINHGCKVIGHMCKVDRRWTEKLVCLFKRLHNRAQVCDVNYALSRGMETFNFNPQLCEKIFQFLPWPTFSVLSNEAAHRQACHCLLRMACN